MHSAVYDPIRDRMVVFGGAGDDPPARNDVWALSLASSPAWTELTPAGSLPHVRNRHSAIYDPVRDRMVVFGGFGNAGQVNDVWALTLSGTPAWSKLAPTGTPPIPRWGHTGTYDSIRDRLVVFGGNAEFGPLGDVWALTLSGTPAWSELIPNGTPPVERHGHTAVYDPMRDRLVVFGGDYRHEWDPSFGPYLGDVWSLSLSGTPAWLELLAAGATPGRWGHTALHDPARDRMVVFAGHECRKSYFNDARALWFGQVIGVTPPQAPGRISLGQSRPNPARGEVEIPFVLPRPARVTLRIYDPAGRAVRTVLDGVLPAGSHAPRWDGRTSRGGKAAPGVYLYELRAEGHRATRRLVRLP